MQDNYSDDDSGEECEDDAFNKKSKVNGTYKQKIFDDDCEGDDVSDVSDNDEDEDNTEGEEEGEESEYNSEDTSGNG